MNPSGIMKESKSFFETPNLAKKLKSSLTFKDELLAVAMSKLEDVKQKFKNKKKEFVFVGIHSRRTDHLKHQSSKGDVLLKPSYYLGI